MESPIPTLTGAAAPSGEQPAAPDTPARWPWLLAGVASGAFGLGVAGAVAAYLAPAAAPLVVVGAAFVDRVPPGLKVASTRLFGTGDKVALFVGAAFVLVLASALTGLTARRRPLLAGLLALGLSGVAVAAAATRPDATGLTVVPSLTAGAAGLLALVVLTRRIGDPGAAGGAGPDRRGFLLATGAVMAGGAAADAVGRTLARRGDRAVASRAAVVLPRPVSPAPALPDGVSVGVPGVAPFIVPNRDFYRIDTALVVPNLAAEDWKLRIHGLVDREVTLDYATLLRSGLVERDLTLICVSNDVGGQLTGNARWLGLPIGPLLAQAGPQAGADMVLSRSVDGWTAGTPLDVLTDGRDALLAIGMNGEPLPMEHGFPVRMVVPGLYGYVSATKWVVDLEVTRFDRAQGYWTPRGWSARGPVKTESRIDVPANFATVRAGTVPVAGVAWAEHRGITAVEVAVDDGAWQPARLGAEDSVDTWRQWVFSWNATAGHHKLAVRATDNTGAPQTGQIAPAIPDGATGWHTIEVDVV